MYPRNIDSIAPVNGSTGGMVYELDCAYEKSARTKAKAFQELRNRYRTRRDDKYKRTHLLAMFVFLQGSKRIDDRKWSRGGGMNVQTCTKRGFPWDWSLRNRPEDRRVGAVIR